jgi:predicted metal-dependent peptidase
MTQKLSAEQRVKKAHIWLMNEPTYCLYSGVIMMGKTEVIDTCPTAYTDGFNTKYGRKFVDKLDEPELRGLILHENLHKAFRHLTVWENLSKENPMLANMACDYVINLLIHDSDPQGKSVRLPEGGLLDEKFRGLDAGSVYRMLKEDQEKKGKGDGDGKESGGDGAGEKTAGLDEHGWGDAKEMSAAEKEKIANDIDQALRQGALLAGKLKGNVPREISEILESKVDWREVLREFVTSYCSERDLSTWRRPNRRWVDRDVYLPSMIGESAGRMVVAIDMSGSIGAAEIGKFLGEVREICKSVIPEGIDLLYWDTEVCQHETYDKDTYDMLLTSTKPRGGGGTDPSCIPQYLKDKRIKPECAIVLTDGLVSRWGTWDCPVLWGITSKGITADVGVSVHVADS